MLCADTVTHEHHSQSLDGRVDRMTSDIPLALKSCVQKERAGLAWVISNAECGQESSIP